MSTKFASSEEGITSIGMDGVDAQIVEAPEKPAGNGSREHGQPTPAQSEPLGLMEPEARMALHGSKGPLTIGQPVFHLAFGSGEVAVIDGDDITVRVGDTEAKVKAHDLVTRAQAEIDWHANWLRGEPWILEDGRRLSIVKDLCRYGEYQAFLDKYDLARSTCDEHIRRYKNSITWAAQDQQLAGNRAIDETEPVAVPDQDRKFNPRAPDPGAEKIEEKVTQERKKRIGRKPSHHRTDWSIRIKLPEEVVGICRAKYKEAGAKEWWRRAAFAFIGLDPDAATQPVTTHAPTPAVTKVTEEVMPNIAPQVDDVAADVTDILRDERVSAEEPKRLQFTPGSDFNTALREATNQLKPGV